MINIEHNETTRTSLKEGLVLSMLDDAAKPVGYTYVHE
jgi:hypothetical protein